MLKAAFIGAGRRAQSVHYPSLHRLDDVSIEAVAELDESLIKSVVDEYNIPRSFDDYHKMLDEVELDAVYVIMGHKVVTPPALDCLNAGKHVFIEKPAGANSDETQQLLDAAVANNVFCSVGYQRRFGALTQEAMRLVKEHGPVTMAMGEFHKPGDYTEDLTDECWSDICHVIDVVRFMVGSEAVEVTAYQDAHENGVKNCFNGLIRFANRSVGVISGSRTTGGRYIRTELHGIGVGCYLRIPDEMELLEDNGPPRILTGAEVAGSDPDDDLSYNGVLAMHRHIADCIAKGQTPSTDIRDVIHTSRLVDQLAGFGS